MALSYVNNLWLVPKYLSAKKYGRFILYGIINLIVFAGIFIIAVKLIKLQYPKISIHHISLISTPVGTLWTIPELLSELLDCVFGFALWVFIMTMAWYMNDYYRQRKLLEAAQQKQIETELHFLKSQVNPHFLFNTLNNLYGLALKKTDTAPDAILRLSSILRYMLYESNTERVSFEKEKEIMQAYIDLELLRLPPSPDFHFNIQADKDYYLPPLLWLPVLENIFKHATRVITDKYFIDYNLSIINNVFTLSSRNNYKAANGNHDKSNSGIGLDNLRKRLDLLYPGKYHIDITTTDDSYTINIRLAL